ncbi:helix-turn-helix domain containing protein [Amycolatopsis anabasis]|uniref:helix-turn-helix domain containing protein n=1 Tax=Amycolatopsis anabasis TaxID=1840409 RepID=UPI00131ACF22|nr:helix-turn-helix domain containing protein [Amycolatopsis anabasis]
MIEIQQCRTEIRQDDNTYSVEVTASKADPATVLVRIGAAGPRGEPVADGRIEVAPGSAPALGTLLAEALHSAVGLDPPGRRRNRDSPAKRGRPWTSLLDAELERRWLAGESVEDIAKHFERTPGGIRARLPRVGCDPVNPGEYLPVPPSKRVRGGEGAMD